LETFFVVVLADCCASGVDHPEEECVFDTQESNLLRQSEQNKRWKGSECSFRILLDAEGLVAYINYS